MIELKYQIYVNISLNFKSERNLIYKQPQVPVTFRKYSSSKNTGCKNFVCIYCDTLHAGLMKMQFQVQ